MVRSPGASRQSGRDPGGERSCKGRKWSPLGRGLQQSRKGGGGRWRVERAGSLVELAASEQSRSWRGAAAVGPLDRGTLSPGQSCLVRAESAQGCEAGSGAVWGTEVAAASHRRTVQQQWAGV